MDFFLFPPLKIRRYVEAAGLVIEEIIEREPYPPEVEYQSRRRVLFCPEAGLGLAERQATTVPQEARDEGSPPPPLIIAHMPRPHDPRFQFAVVMVRDQDRSVRFYVDQLGFRLVADQQVPLGDRWIVVEPPEPVRYSWRW